MVIEWTSVSPRPPYLHYAWNRFRTNHFVVKFVIGVITILFIAFNVRAESACYELFYNSATTIPQSPSSLTVRSLLPKAFIDQIEAAHGPMKILIEEFDGIIKTIEKSDDPHENLKDYYNDYKKTHRSLSITITIGKNLHVLKFQLAFEKAAPQNAVIIYLELTDPNSTVDSSKMHQTQRKKGIAFDVLIETRHRLFSYLFSKGVRRLTVESMSDYTVSILYRRFLGFAPATSFASEIFEVIDTVYEKAKKLPIEIRPKSLDDFSRSMMRLRTTDKFLEVAREELLRHQSGQQMNPTTRIIHDDNGEFFALVLDYGFENQKVFYLYNGKFLRWREVSADKKTQLSIDLTP